MSGRGRVTARRRPGGRASAKRRDSGRSVSEEITVLVNTLRELAAIRATAEDAAGRILDSAEGLLAFADKEEAKKAEEAILAIMTACGFHDLVGQRVTKIAETLDQVIATRMKAEQGRKRPAPPSRKSRLTLEGPGLTGTSDEAQARIDAIFREN
jgi:chemotaxis regulatin CheY-phosphate phosphatase CheZ